MATSTFSGPLRIGNSDTVVGVVPAARTLSIIPAAATDTRFTLAMPAQYGALRITFYTTTAFTGTTANITVGTTLDGTEVLGVTNIKSAGVASGTIVIANPTNMTATTLFIRLAQSTTPTAVGAAQMVIEYLPISG
jgi:hypothetical protein